MTILIYFAIYYIAGIFILPAIDNKDNRIFNWAKSGGILFHAVVILWPVIFYIWWVKLCNK